MLRSAGPKEFFHNWKEMTTKCKKIVLLLAWWSLWLYNFRFFKSRHVILCNNSGRNEQYDGDNVLQNNVWPSKKIPDTENAPQRFERPSKKIPGPEHAPPRFFVAIATFGGAFFVSRNFLWAIRILAGRFLCPGFFLIAIPTLAGRFLSPGFFVAIR